MDAKPERPELGPPARRVEEPDEAEPEAQP